jgi:dipeptidyl-peptidase 4
MRITSIKSRVLILLHISVLIVLSSCKIKTVDNQDATSKQQNLSMSNDSIVNYPQIYLEKIDANWFDGNSKFWYKCNRPNGTKEFIMVDAKTGEKRAAFDHAKVAALIGNETKAGSLPVYKLEFTEGADSLFLILNNGSTWLFNNASNSLIKAPERIISSNKKSPEPDSSASPDLSDATRPVEYKTSDKYPKTVLSPDGKKEAFVKNNNLWLRDMATKSEMQLSADGSRDFSYHRDAVRIRSLHIEVVFMRYNHPDFPETLPEVYWSPDSKYLVAIRSKVVSESRLELAGMIPQFQFRKDDLPSIPYLRIGGEIPTQDVHLFNVNEAKAVKLDHSLWDNPLGLSKFRWDKASESFYFRYLKRGFQLIREIRISARDKKAMVIVEEKSKTFVDQFKTYGFPLKDGKELFYTSERDGWNHLYMFDAINGGLKRQLTKGEWVVRSIERVDEKAGLVWYWAGGVNKEEDPYYLHLGKAKIDGSGWEIVTSGNGTHTVVWSPDRKYFIDTWSRVDLPPVHVLRDAEDGNLICELEKADATEFLNRGYKFSKPFVAKGRDGSTDIYGIIHYPYNFNPKEKYPIIEYIYSGPMVAVVPKEFATSYFSTEILKRNGYVVVQIDGMGTNCRSKAFQDVAWKNIQDAGFPDRILWIKAAAAEYPWMDTTRVGIYGCSAGGQSAMRAVLDHSDFYKASVADCGIHDNRLDITTWSERWLGWPIDSSYAASSNIDDAYKLGGALLLTVGEEDKICDPSCTYKAIEALTKAGKEFEYMTFPGQGHGAGFCPKGDELRLKFFNKHLKN